MGATMRGTSECRAANLSPASSLSTQIIGLPPSFSVTELKVLSLSPAIETYIPGVPERAQRLIVSIGASQKNIGVSDVISSTS